MKYDTTKNVKEKMKDAIKSLLVEIDTTREAVLDRRTGWRGISSAASHLGFNTGSV